MSVEPLEHALHGRLEERLAVHLVTLKVELLDQGDQALDPGEVVGQVPAEAAVALVPAHTAKARLVEAIGTQLLEVGAGEPT